MVEARQETLGRDACPTCGHVCVDAKFCDRCGTRLPVRVACASCRHVNADAKFCEQCGEPLGDAMNPYAAPVDDRGVTTTAAERLPLASHGARLGAAFVDAICISLVNVPLLLAAGLFPSDGRPLELTKTVLAVGLGFLVFTVVQGYFLLYGQTIGKRMLGLRMVDAETGDPAPIGRLLSLRYLPLAISGLLGPAGSILSLVDTLLIFRTDRRCLHDHIARTRVVSER